MIRHLCECGMFVRESRPQGVCGTIVYIHGLGESGLCFERLIAEPRLDRWHQLAPDLPGYGKSPFPDRPTTLS